MTLSSLLKKFFKPYLFSDNLNITFHEIKIL